MSADEDRIPFYVQDTDLFFHEAREDPARYVRELRCQGRISPREREIPRAQCVRLPFIN